MEIALYARVSTTHQQQTQTIDQQLTRLRAAVATHPDWHLAAEHIYCDDGQSGAKLNRPGLDRLRDHAALAAFEVVLITAPDRLARKYVHQMLLIEELTGRGCQVEFLDRPMSDNPHDQLLLQIRGAVAEYERTLIADRMRRGRHAKLRSGVLLPWTRIPYGYLVDPEHPRDATRVRVDPVKAALIEQLFAWYTDPVKPTSLYGLRMKLHALGIASPMGKPYWSESAIRGMLRSPTYTGIAYGAQTRTTTAQRRRSRLQPVGGGVAAQMLPREEWIGVTVPAIVSIEIWQRAQARLDENKRFARRNNHAHEYLLRGLVYCGRCQYGCSGRNADGAYRYYICSGRSRAHCSTPEQRCPARYIPAERLDAFVWQDLCQIIANPTMITHELTRAQQGDWLPQAVQARRQTLNQTLAHLDREQQRLLDVFLAEVIGREEFERKRQELGQTQEALRQQLRQLDAHAQHHLDVAALDRGITDFCARMQATLKQLDFAQRRKVVELLIDAVVVTDGEVEIRYVIPTGPAGEQLPFCHLRKDYFDIVLPGFSRINLMFDDSQRLIDGLHALSLEDRAAIAHDRLGGAMIADGAIEDHEIGRHILDGGYDARQHRAAVVINDTDTVDHTPAERVHIQIPNIHTPIFMGPRCPKGHGERLMRGRWHGLGPFGGPLLRQNPGDRARPEPNAIFLFESRTNTEGAEQRVLPKFLDNHKRAQGDFPNTALGRTGARMEDGKIVGAKADYNRMHGLATGLEIASDAFGGPALKMQVDDSAAAGLIRHGMKDGKAPTLVGSGRRLRQHPFDGAGTGTVRELVVANTSDLVDVEGRIVGVELDNELPGRERQGMRGRRVRGGGKAGKALGGKAVEMPIEGADGFASFECAGFSRIAKQDDGPD